MILAAFNLGPQIQVHSPSGSPLFGIPLSVILLGMLGVYVAYRMLKKPGTLGDKLEEIPLVVRELLELALSRGLPPRAAQLVQQALTVPSVPVPSAPVSIPVVDPIVTMMAQAQATYSYLNAKGDKAGADAAAALYNRLKAAPPPIAVPPATPPAAGTVPA